jgi:hypothetical protein
MTLFSEIIILPKLMFYLLIISGFIFVLAVIVAHFSGVLKQIYTANYHQRPDNKHNNKDQSKFKRIFNIAFARRHVVDSIEVGDIKQCAKEGNDCAKNLPEHTNNVTREAETRQPNANKTLHIVY